MVCHSSTERFIVGLVVEFITHMRCGFGNEQIKNVFSPYSYQRGGIGYWIARGKENGIHWCLGEAIKRNEKFIRLASSSL